MIKKRARVHSSVPDISAGLSVGVVSQSKMYVIEQVNEQSCVWLRVRNITLDVHERTVTLTVLIGGKTL